MVRPTSNRPGLAATMPTEWAAALRLASRDFTQQLRRKCGCRRFAHRDAKKTATSW